MNSLSQFDFLTEKESSKIIGGSKGTWVRWGIDVGLAYGSDFVNGFKHGNRRQH